MTILKIIVHDDMTVRIAVFILIAAALCGLAFSQSDAGTAVADDEILKIKQEIQQLRILLKELTGVLSAEQKEKLNDVIKKLEEKITDNQQQDKPSDTGNSITHLKQSIEKIKEDLKKLTGGILFSGFFDVSASTYKNNPNIFELGNFELDMDKSVGRNFQVAAALVFDKDSARMDVGFIDYHLFGGRVKARGRMFLEKGFHLQVGRFDVTLGNDWQYTSSADRVSVTAPLTTDLIMDGGYNDVGLRILRSAVLYNYSVYVLRGIGQGFAVGGRLVFTPFNSAESLKKKELKQLEAGVSYLNDLDRDGHSEQKIFALEFENGIGPFRLQGEYIRRDWIAANTLRKGLHLSAFLDTSKLSKLSITLYSRYDYFRQKPSMNAEEEKTTLQRVCMGLCATFYDISMLKFEFLHFIQGSSEFKGSSIYMQLVITF